MDKVIVLLCLGLIGCSTVPRENKILRPASERSGAVSGKESAAYTANVAVDQKEVDELIAIFSASIKKNPNYAGAYYNRAAAYFHKQDYDKSWKDIHKAEELGIDVDPKFIELVDKLKKASGRDK
jgi:tetratricopeptide (TPR) repeat protein